MNHGGRYQADVEGSIGAKAVNDVDAPTGNHGRVERSTSRQMRCGTVHPDTGRMDPALAGSQVGTDRMRNLQVDGRIRRRDMNEGVVTAPELSAQRASKVMDDGVYTAARQCRSTCACANQPGDLQALITGQAHDA
ncbi:hypothetical protein JCM18899A_38260 [Nocardioides sp. AN3]